jgi:hypothetical protein
MPVGVVVERHKATSPWVDYVWRPAAVLSGVPAAAPWTPLGTVGDTTSFYAGTATIALHRTETANYISNLSSGAPQLWVVLFTEAGNDLVDTVPMPADIKAALEAFIADHHVERAFYKRQRDSGAEGALRGGRKPREGGP